jgi:hypothetical protein
MQPTATLTPFGSFDLPDAQGADNPWFQPAALSADCAEEWERARIFCAELYERNLLGLPGFGRTIAQCMRGQVSERCGGNPVEW